MHLFWGVGAELNAPLMEGLFLFSKDLFLLSGFNFNISLADPLITYRADEEPAAFKFRSAADLEIFRFVVELEHIVMKHLGSPKYFTWYGVSTKLYF